MSVKNYTLAQNHATFSSFLSISSCITNSESSEFSSFISKSCKTFEKIGTQNSGNLLKLFKRYIVAFIYENIYCHSNNKNKLYKVLQSIYKLFPKSVQKKYNPNIRPRKNKKSNKSSIHYFDMSKGKKFRIFFFFIHPILIFLFIYYFRCII